MYSKEESQESQESLQKVQKETQRLIKSKGLAPGKFVSFPFCARCNYGTILEINDQFKFIKIVDLDDEIHKLYFYAKLENGVFVLKNTIESIFILSDESMLYEVSDKVRTIKNDIRYLTDKYKRKLIPQLRQKKKLIQLGKEIEKNNFFNYVCSLA